MKAITLILDDDEIMFMRMQARMIRIMMPETNEQIESYMKKILDATSDISDDSKKEIGIMQRAMRRVREMPEYKEFMNNFKIVEKLLIAEMEKEKK